MSLLEQSVEVGAVIKVALFAVGLGGSFALLRDDIGDLDHDKASNERVAVIETKVDAIPTTLARIEAKLDKVDEKLDKKADKP